MKTEAKKALVNNLPNTVSARRLNANHVCFTGKPLLFTKFIYLLVWLGGDFWNIVCLWNVIMCYLSRTEKAPEDFMTNTKTPC